MIFQKKNKKTVKFMKRQKPEPGSLHSVYLFQHQLTFTSGLGNYKKKKLYLMKKLYEFSKDALCFF